MHASAQQLACTRDLAPEGSPALCGHLSPAVQAHKAIEGTGHTPYAHRSYLTPEACQARKISSPRPFLQRQIALEGRPFSRDSHSISERTAFSWPRPAGSHSSSRRSDPTVSPSSSAASYQTKYAPSAHWSDLHSCSERATLPWLDSVVGATASCDSNTTTSSFPLWGPEHGQCSPRSDCSEMLSDDSFVLMPGTPTAQL